MSVSIATMGMFRDCCGGGPGGGGAPPVYQYEARGEDFASQVMQIDVKKVYAKKPKMPEIAIDVGKVRSERKV